jgi:hypothetical protein
MFIMKIIGLKSRHSLIVNLILILSIILSSCVQNSGLRGRSLSSVSTGKITGGTNAGGGNAAVPTGESAVPGIGTGTTVMSQMVELSHFVDPFDGSYKKKLTLPKNFKGNLYLSGLNVSSLASKLIKVRFNFGRERQAVVLDATLARAPGIIPNTAIQVLVVDMNLIPFANMRLGYDLYDYNDYGTTAAPTALDVVTDPRDSGLYCRGLLLEDDPTFAQGGGSICNGVLPAPVPPALTSAPAAVCKYAYAKVTDATLQYPVTTPGNIPATVMYDKIPTQSLVWGALDPAPNVSASFMSNMCLPDLNYAGFSPGIFSFAAMAAGLPSGLKFNFPYRHINFVEWQLSGLAVYSPFGLYVDKGYTSFSQIDPLIEGFYNGSTIGQRYQSLLFPRAGKLLLGPNVNYYGSDTKFSARSQLISDASGTTQYVDGCNLRVMNIDPVTNEGIGSCNVSANIEVFYMNASGQEVLITKDNTLKLQLVRPSTKDYLGKEVLTSAFKSCTSSTTCGSNECCYNSRCWSKDLVTQCVDQLPLVGNQVIGANCRSDYECSSLCCNLSSGSCAPHNPNAPVPNFCAKSPGQQCVAKEFCRKDFVNLCKVTRVPGVYNPNGSQVCSLRCAPVETFGTCLESGVISTCVPPPTPVIPTALDVTNCVNAVDP